MVLAVSTTNVHKDRDTDDVVAVKLYQRNSDLLIDQNYMIDSMVRLAVNCTIVSPVLLTFKNGFIYKYAFGEKVPDNEHTL
jgi:hypothetical protein